MELTSKTTSIRLHPQKSAKPEHECKLRQHGLPHATRSVLCIDNSIPAALAKVQEKNLIRSSYGESSNTSVVLSWKGLAYAMLYNGCQNFHLIYEGREEKCKNREKNNPRDGKNTALEMSSQSSSLPDMLSSAQQYYITWIA